MPPQSALKPGDGLCSPGLKKLLTESDGADGACRLIRINPTLRAECEAVAPLLASAKAPASEVEIMEILIRNAPAYGVSAPAGGNWAFLFGPYLEALEGYPAYAIEDAFLRWNRGEGHANLQMASFYPKPGQLVMLAQKGKAELFMAAYRAERALKEAEKAPRKISDDERRQVAEGMRALAASMQAKRIPDPGTPRKSPQEVAAELRAKAEKDFDVV
jgi:hypothetical protein